MPEIYSNLLTEADAARYLSVNKVTLWRWRKRGIGPAWIKLPGAAAYRIEDLNQWIMALRIQASFLPQPWSGPRPAWLRMLDAQNTTTSD